MKGSKCGKQGSIFLGMGRDGERKWNGDREGKRESLKGKGVKIGLAGRINTTPVKKPFHCLIIVSIDE